MASVHSHMDEQSNNEVLVDVHLYVKQYSRNFKERNTFQHLSGLRETVKQYWSQLPDYDILAQTKDHWEEDHCRTLLTAQPWLYGFKLLDGDMTGALQALSVSMNSCTRSLLQLNVTLSNSIILADWKLLALERLKADAIIQKRKCYPENWSTFVANIMDDHLVVPGTDDINRDLWHYLQDCARDFWRHKQYKIFNMKVSDFCLRAGSPATKHNPVENIHSLRAHLSRGSMVEAELRKELEELRKLTRMQQRMITNLTFRNLLEMLPPHSTGSSSATSRWKNFFTSALQNAQAQQANQTSNHPFVSILRKYPKTKQIEDTGANLYGLLSTNIHHYSGKFMVAEDQWNVLEVEVLKALIPLAQNQSDTGVDWDTERMRY
ncbi:hypothetical protein H2198_002021 [Neophaeococcomyces mojaviensis]|uniref:Uncharacterized protein n=1 Tax=Neophaeococcomyces mojaviensis TaxID=3383035 RepID=A0ACC3AFD3_9EURO|nr:hypothetical protein H2198_002021 [Knufia sp. JES_112]